MEGKALLAAVLMSAVALAGCTGDGGGGGAVRIVETPADPMSEPYVFEAAVSADEYKWDMGDGRRLAGEQVSHVFGVNDGTFNVKLTTVSGGEEETHAPLTVTVGAGDAANAAPDFRLDFEWTWVQVGEEVSFSAASSSDPDGDTLLFSWFCRRTSDIGFAGAGHAHAPGGVQFGSGSASTIPTRVLNGTGVPSPEATVDGDMCADMGSPNQFTTDATIRGAFTESGIYEVTMLAKDPVHPTEPAVRAFYVTDFARQDPVYNETFSGTIQTGVPGEFDPVAEAAGQQDHIQTHSFSIDYPILGAFAGISTDDGDGVPVEIEYEVLKGTSSKHGPNDDDMQKGAGDLTQGDYTINVYLRQGSNVGYDVDLTVEYETNPDLIFEPPGGH